jgi:transposase
MIAQRTAAASNEESYSADALLAGIALSRDSRFLPTLRQMAAARHDEWELRKVLQALRGMTGPDARQLRLEINKQIRNAAAPGGLRID